MGEGCDAATKLLNGNLRISFAVAAAARQNDQLTEQGNKVRTEKHACNSVVSTYKGRGQLLDLSFFCNP